MGLNEPTKWLTILKSIDTLKMPNNHMLENNTELNAGKLRGKWLHFIFRTKTIAMYVDAEFGLS